MNLYNMTSDSGTRYDVTGGFVAGYKVTSSRYPAAKVVQVLQFL